MNSVKEFRAITHFFIAFVCYFDPILVPYTVMQCPMSNLFLEDYTPRTAGASDKKRKVYSGFNTVFLSLLLLAAGVGFPAACFWR